MYGLAEFIKDLEDITSSTENQNQIVKKAKSALKRLLNSKNFSPVLNKELSDNSRYLRYLVYEDPNKRFYIFSMLWPPNNESPIHDHNGTWGIEGVYEGRLRVKNFIKLLDKDKLKLKILSQFVLNQHEIADLTSKLNIHKIENLDNKSISIHVYGEKLMKMNIYNKLNNNDEYLMEEKALSVDN